MGRFLSNRRPTDSEYMLAQRFAHDQGRILGSIGVSRWNGDIHVEFDDDSRFILNHLGQVKSEVTVVWNI